MLPFNRFKQLLILTALTFWYCTPPPPPRTPDARPVERPASSATPTSADSGGQPAATDDFDFASAFDETTGPAPVPSEPVVAESFLLHPVTEAADQPVPAEPAKRPAGPPRDIPLAVPTTRVRVVLFENRKNFTFYSAGSVRFDDGVKRRGPWQSGRFTIAAGGRGEQAMVTTASGARFRFSLPCTLAVENSYNYIDIEENSFRGGLLFTAGDPGVSVINVLPVEEYLRGVVALEIGRRAEADMEALKAQAVAARTYTYKKIVERRSEPYDLQATVADQVYGGVNAEFRTTDKAVKLTDGQVMVWNDSIVFAYYHSTCGGSTADIEDVWDKPPYPYLRSISDRDPKGAAWCAASAYSSWNESWSVDQLSQLLARFAPSVLSAGTYKGTFKDLMILGHAGCGRISLLRILSSQGSCEVKGDKIRFALRRPAAGNPILQSARFSVTDVTRSRVSVRGSGNGHGVGMCQMGAIGRARAGMSCEQILKAYYTGIDIRRVRAE